MTAPLPADILAALASDGEIPLTPDQLCRLIAWEAAQMGLTFSEAEASALAGTLARTALGCDVDMLLRLWSYQEHATTSAVRRAPS